MLHELTARKLPGVVAAALGTAALTGAMAPIEPALGLLNAGLLLLLLTLVISAVWGWQVGAFAAVLTNVALNFFFVEPLHRLTVRQPENTIGLGVFLIVSIVGGSLLSAARSAAAEARRREAETQAMLSISRAMTGHAQPADALFALCQEAVRAFAAPGASVLSEHDDAWRVLAFAGRARASRATDAEERAMARQAVAAQSVVRVGRTGLARTRRVRIVRAPGAPSHGDDSGSMAFVPLRVGSDVLGILRLDGPIGNTSFRQHPERLLEAFAGEAALALQRLNLARVAARADALKQADEMKSVLMTSVSHDLKTPLSAIKTAVSSLRDAGVAWSAEDTSEFLSTIDSQTERLDRVISSILDLNRIESGAVKLDARSIYVSDLFDDARESSATATAGRRVQADAGAGLRVIADESLVRQALVNLVENAAKYSTPGGDIRLRAESAGDRIEIAVEDDGPGISPNDLPHVFDRFYRAQSGRSRVSGSGLGLAIVKGFVTLCGGSVRVESSDAGTRFVVTLPSANTAAQA